MSIRSAFHPAICIYVSCLTWWICLFNYNSCTAGVILRGAISTTVETNLHFRICQEFIESQWVRIACEIRNGMLCDCEGNVALQLFTLDFVLFLFVSFRCEHLKCVKVKNTIVCNFDRTCPRVSVCYFTNGFMIKFLLIKKNNYAADRRV